MTPPASQTEMVWSQWNTSYRGCLTGSCPGSNLFLTVGCVTMVPTAARISAADAVRCATATRRIWRSSFSVVARGYPETGLLDLLSLDLCSQQRSCTVFILRSSLSAISRKENPPSHTPITTR
ncbi:uncharacterized protein TNCV_1389501 [Trichonephila clavipes]|nr:uncharacterized protein TNCV_1389501 [Trichonephila clavipes]